MSKNLTDSEHHEVANVALSDSARYILFLIDSRMKGNDGKIFCSYSDAKAYAHECITEKYCDKAVIGMFSLNTQAKEMLISMVETIGFAGDKKNVNQLALFRNNVKD